MVHILWKMAALKACPRTFLSGVQLYLNSSIVCSWDSTVILSDIAFIAILLFLKDALIRIFKAKAITNPRHQTHLISIVYLKLCN